MHGSSWQYLIRGAHSLMEPFKKVSDGKTTTNCDVEPVGSIFPEERNAESQRGFKGMGYSHGIRRTEEKENRKGVSVPGSNPYGSWRTEESDPKVIPKWSQSAPKVVPKWSQSGPKVIPKWSQSDPKVVPK